MGVNSNPAMPSLPLAGLSRTGFETVSKSAPAIRCGLFLPLAAAHYERQKRSDREPLKERLTVGPLGSNFSPRPASLVNGLIIAGSVSFQVVCALER